MVFLFNIKKKQLENVATDKVLFSLYNLEYRLPTNLDINKKFKNKKNINDIKIEISKIDTHIPLYDTYSENMYLIVKYNVYNRVIRQHYRFPDKDIFNTLIKKQKQFKKTEDILLKRKQRKIDLMVKFLSYFDLDILYETYIKVFYLFTNEVGKNITQCKKPSFLPQLLHITPYYSRSELINMALNIELIKPNDEYYDKQKLEKLCRQIQINDISSDTILNHYNYIVNSSKVGIIQYYSLQGSYFMNQYLRNQTSYNTRNLYLESLIDIMWKTINNAPKFDKSYVVYRFIENDSYLSHLSVGDEFIDPGFISTTRDPFYNSESFKFGFILIKIKIPANKHGVALCMETVSHFPKEQEIILSPLSIFKLKKKDSNCAYYHTDNNFATKVKTRYEFTYIGKKNIKFIERPQNKHQRKTVDFINIDRPQSMTINEKIRIFMRTHVDKMFQYTTNIGDKDYTVFIEWYDSTEVYKPFYAASVQDGFLMYTIDDNNVSFTIELGENKNPYMYVNFYFRYTQTNRDTDIKIKDFIKFISSIGYYFNIQTIIIYADYTMCVDNEISFGGNYCVDFYNYLKDKKKRFKGIDSTVIKPKFGYYQLDRLRNTKPDTILDKEDRDELYQIYNKTYIPFMDKSKDNIADFYIWIIDNYCYLSIQLTNKMYRLYHKQNPFTNDYYILDPIGYLYSSDIISTYRHEYETKEKYTDFPKNTYRVDSTVNPRVPSTRSR
jgi:hypothetical protein